MIAVVVFLCLVFANINAHVSFLKRSEAVLPENLMCNRSTPCAWEIYSNQPGYPTFRRVVQHYMQSPCQCPNGTTCKRSYEKISISSYVHLCKLENGDNATTTAETTDSTVE